MSDRVYYNKLVRDGIKAKIEGKGERCSVRVIKDEAEFQQELLKKVQEEASAVAQARSREEFIAEYADLMVVLDTLTQVLEVSPAEIEITLQENVAKKGWFKDRQFLEWSQDSEYQSNETPQGIK